MLKPTLCLIVFGFCLSTPVAWACKPLLPRDQVREFARSAQPSEAVVFTGDVTSVNTDQRANGDLVTDTTLRPTRWWTGYRDGVVVIQTITSAGSPCPNLSTLNAGIGEHWLIFGRIRNPVVDSSVEARAWMRLEHGRVPPDVLEDLRRMETGR